MERTTDEIVEISSIPIKLVSASRDNKGHVFIEYDHDFWKYLEQSEKGWPVKALEEQLSTIDPDAFHVWDSMRMGVKQKDIATSLAKTRANGKCSITTVKRLYKKAKDFMSKAVDYEYLETEK